VTRVAGVTSSEYCPAGR